MTRERRTPYTARGIGRVPCARCGKPSVYQWSACADRNVWRGLCDLCDVLLNEVVLRFMRDPRWREKVARYRARHR